MSTIAVDARQCPQKHICAVDHDPELLDLICELLQGESYCVTATTFIDRLWERIAALQPDLVLIDLRPQSQYGRDLLTRLHAEKVTAGIPVIVTSTEPRLLHGVLRERERYGCERVLPKPLDIYALLGCIDDIFDKD